MLDSTSKMVQEISRLGNGRRLWRRKSGICRDEHRHQPPRQKAGRRLDVPNSRLYALGCLHPCFVFHSTATRIREFYSQASMVRALSRYYYLSRIPSDLCPGTVSRSPSSSSLWPELPSHASLYSFRHTSSPSSPGPWATLTKLPSSPWLHGTWPQLLVVFWPATRQTRCWVQSTA